MSFDLQLVRFQHGDAASWDNEAVARIIPVIRRMKPDFLYDPAAVQNSVVVEWPDAFSLEIDLARPGTSSGLRIAFRRLSVGIVSFVFDLAHAGELAVFNLQGNDTVVNPSVIVLDPRQLRHLPAGTYKQPACADSAKALGLLLLDSFDSWSAYRRQVLDAARPEKPALDRVRPVFDAITWPVTDDLREPLWDRVCLAHAQYGLGEALHGVLSALDPAHCWLCLQVDARDDGEIEWQARAMAMTCGLPKGYKWRRNESLDCSQVYDGLLAYDTWLKAHGCGFVIWNDGSDMYAGFVLRVERIAEFQRVAAAANMNCYPIREMVAVLPGFSIKEILPGRASLAEEIKSEMASAQSMGRQPHVYVMASWCEPCRALVALLGDLIVSAVFKGTHIVMLDVELWGDQFEKLNIRPSSVPFITELGPDGRSTGRSIDGGAWDENTPENLARALGPYFRTG